MVVTGQEVTLSATVYSSRCLVTDLTTLGTSGQDRQTGTIGASNHEDELDISDDNVDVDIGNVLLSIHCKK